jgi:type I restriction enzyme S subunit
VSWPKTEFQDLYEVPSKNGLTRPARVRGSGYKMVNMGELFAHDRIGNIEMELVPMNDKELSSMLVEKGDLLFARQSLVLAGAGKCSIVSEAEEPTTFESHIIRIRLKKETANPDFYYYYFKSPSCGIRAIVTQGVQAGIRGNDLKLLPVHVPPLEEQKRIAEVLATYDDLIENNRRRMALLEEAARQLYREWFVRLRFPGHEHTRIIDGVPEGWKDVSASEILDINPKEKIEKGSVATYVPMSSLPESGMTVERGDFEERTKHTSIKFRNGDTLFARITPSLENGKTGFADFLGEDEVACGSTEIIVLRGAAVSPYFTYCLARTYDFRENAIKSMIGSSGRQRVQNSCFDKFRLPLPPKVLREEFDQTAIPCFRQIKNLADQNHRLRTARDLLLPRLMNGEIAV